MIENTPDALLRTLLSALQAGVEDGAPALWKALSDRARGPLGGVEGVTRALQNPLWAPLLLHERNEIEPWDVLPGAARTHVRVFHEMGSVIYLVACKQDAHGAWRISGLTRDDMPWG